jgi:hypothetical protein
MPFDAVEGKIALEHNQKKAFEAISEMEKLN